MMRRRDVGNGSASRVGNAACRRCEGGVDITARGLVKMMDIIFVACQEFELTVSENTTEVMHLWSDPSTASNAL